MNGVRESCECCPCVVLPPRPCSLRTTHFCLNLVSFTSGPGYLKCRSCPSGTLFNASDGRTSSFPCACEQLGTFREQESCRPCPRGTFGSSGGLTAAAQCTGCLPGTYGSAPGLVLASECSNCSVGKFSSGFAITSDAQCVLCPAGKEGKCGNLDGGLVRDSETTGCSTCTSGKYSDVQGSTSCLSCSNSGTGPNADR